MADFPQDATGRQYNLWSGLGKRMSREEGEGGEY
jgi:hypothetical protein